MTGLQIAHVTLDASFLSVLAIGILGPVLVSSRAYWGQVPCLPPWGDVHDLHAIPCHLWFVVLLENDDRDVVVCAGLPLQV